MRETTYISPVPKEYMSYSKQEKIEKTEIYYKQLGALYLKIDGVEEEYKKRMDTVLETQVDVEELLTILNEAEVRMLCHYTHEFSLLNGFCQIAQMEKAFNAPCVLQNIHSMKDVAEWYQKCIFLIRRFELGWEEDNELLDLIRQEKISYIALSELICMDDIIQKNYAGCRIAKYLYVNGCKREALLFIMRLEQKLPYSERKVVNFAMTLLDMGEKQLAYEVLMKHQNPNEDIKELQDVLSKRL